MIAKKERVYIYMNASKKFNLVVFGVSLIQSEKGKMKSIFWSFP